MPRIRGVQVNEVLAVESQHGSTVCSGQSPPESYVSKRRKCNRHFADNSELCDADFGDPVPQRVARNKKCPPLDSNQ